MNERCHSTTSKGYEWYGARGITVCERWRHSFPNFLEDMGPRPKGLTIERRDNDGNYEPGNCYWATKSQQAHNRRSSVFVEHNGKRLCLAEWAAILGIGRWNVRNWLRNGFSMSDLFRLKAEGKFPMKVGQNRPRAKKP